MCESLNKSKRAANIPSLRGGTEMISEENRFFKFVWRFDGIIFMITGVLALIIIAVSGYQLVNSLKRGKDTRETLNIAGNVNTDKQINLGEITDIENTDYIMIPLQSPQNSQKFSSCSSEYRILNILFVNKQNNMGKWLFGNNDHSILLHELLSEKDDCDSDPKIIRAILYEVVNKDTNGDNIVSEDDKKIIALSSSSGDNYKEILSGLDSFIGHKVLDKDTLFLVYQKQGMGYAATVSLSDFSITNQRLLPKVGDKSREIRPPKVSSPGGKRK